MDYAQLMLCICLLAAGLGLYGLRVCRRTKAWRLSAFGISGLALLSWPPAGELTALPFVVRHAEQVGYPADTDAIVVPSGSVNSATTLRPYILLGQDTYKRIMHAAWLFRTVGPLPVLLTGGPTSDQGEPASISMRRALEEQGVPSSMIWTEERSRTTYENASFSAKILQEHGVRKIALVVDADSMLRAEKCFRKQGFSVEPMPCWNHKLELRTGDLLPGWEAIYRQEVLVHEAGGLVWYWIHGWI